MTKVVASSGHTWRCLGELSRVLSTDVADAVNYILQGVLTTGTAGNIGGLTGREAAGKTGTSNVESNNGTPYAAFAGYSRAWWVRLGVQPHLPDRRHDGQPERLLPAGKRHPVLSG